ncbi:type II secretion system protein [Rubrivivax gelatinosus]|uniref:type II secretion system protein n=1 Tax=Rubrivivax gelatinosus TaxID=28068 RepID=UPI001FB3E466|nr:type II secretion system protein [Rubrivivax gelatinosus]
MITSRRSAGGFTLVELLTVMMILAILGWISTPMWQIAVQRERERELKRALWEIRDALDAHRRAVEDGIIEGGASGYPGTLRELVEGRPNLKRIGEKVYFLRRIPVDPFAPTGDAAEKSWGVRSYESTSDDPRPGNNVFDVFSQSKVIGLNGVAINKW